MTRWREISGNDGGDRYAARVDALAATGRDMHGEAAFCAARLAPGGRVLDAGCGTGRVAIRLAELGYAVVGVDADASMLATAGRRSPDLRWVEADLADFDLNDRFDLVLTAGNVIPLLAAGTEATAVARLAAHLAPGGALVSGFGLRPEELPLTEAPVDLPAYDGWCAAAGLALAERYATWDGDPYAGGPYAVSVHRPAPGPAAAP
ncbi:SAM-dependent methyltransferase [Pilimelia anulata]|uniref:SAM-dependent methyltransferase n=1 Tax=Pilimelia anulata TaxID=53371 RepID=A0A8J3B3D6_9ACTN|nr:class I SAM-dependent methyltransferase [Pilimelia anulata]GGJ79285.1 SAM-dependent methyltransferase [Pilimelia anulata]